MPVPCRTRAWYRLHASTWVVAFLVGAVLVVLVAPGAFEATGMIYKRAYYQHGWPWSFLKKGGNYTDGDEDQIPWLQSGAWRFKGHTMSRGPLVADVACALAIEVGIVTAWEWRRRRRERLCQLTLRELLLMTLAIGGGFGWWQANVREGARQERVAFELIEKYGPPLYSQPPADFAFQGPVWLYRLTGRRPYHMLRVTGLYSLGEFGLRPAPEAVQSIATLTHLETLGLGALAEADGDLAPLSGLSRLEGISIADCVIDE